VEKNVRCGKKRRTKEGEQREYEEKSVMRVERNRRRKRRVQYHGCFILLH